MRENVPPIRQSQSSREFFTAIESVPKREIESVAQFPASVAKNAPRRTQTKAQANASQAKVKDMTFTQQPPILTGKNVSQKRQPKNQPELSVVNTKYVRPAAGPQDPAGNKFRSTAKPSSPAEFPVITVKNMPEGKKSKISTVAPAISTKRVPLSKKQNDFRGQNITPARRQKNYGDFSFVGYHCEQLTPTSTPDYSPRSPYSYQDYFPGNLQSEYEDYPVHVLQLTSIQGCGMLKENTPASANAWPKSQMSHQNLNQRGKAGTLRSGAPHRNLQQPQQQRSKFARKPLYSPSQRQQLPDLPSKRFVRPSNTLASSKQILQSFEIPVLEGDLHSRPAKVVPRKTVNVPFSSTHGTKSSQTPSKRSPQSFVIRIHNSSATDAPFYISSNGGGSRNGKPCAMYDSFMFNTMNGVVRAMSSIDLEVKISGVLSGTYLQGFRIFANNGTVPFTLRTTILRKYMMSNQTTIQHHLELPPLPTKVDVKLADPGVVIGAPIATKQEIKRVLVAKKLPPDFLGQEPEYTNPARKPIPLSIVTNAAKGPTLRDGRVVEYSLLGDISDYEEMAGQQSIGGTDPSAKVPEAAQSPTANSVPAQDAAMEDLRRDELRLKRLASAQEKQMKERSRWLDRLYVFQRYRELREEHALRNWKRHSIQWSRVQRSLSKASQKSKSDLLMSRLGEYREKIEERDLIFEAFQLLEDQKVNFWSKGLRIGNDLLGLMVTSPKGGTRRYKEPRDSADYRFQRKSELGHIISKLDPFFNHDSGGFMEVVGKSLGPSQLEKFAEAFVERLQSRQTHGQSANIQPSAFDKEEVVAAFKPLTEEQDGAQTKCLSASFLEKNGLQQIDSDSSSELIFAATHMSFEVLLNEVTRSVLSVYNRSKTAYHFEWTKVVRPKSLNTRASNDGVQRFYFYHKNGVILPGTAFDFPVIFKSASPGIFTEVWELTTNPPVASDVNTKVTLQGFALEADTNLEKRDRLEADLALRVAKTTAAEVIREILGRMNRTTSTTNALEKKRLLLRNDEQLFVALNADLQLQYSQKLFEKFEALANETLIILEKPPTMWNRSVQTIASNISSIPDVTKRSQQLTKLNDLVKASTATRSTSTFSPLYIVAYDTLVDLADRISQASECLRKRMNLPLVRSAAVFERPPGEEEQPTQDRKLSPPAVEPKKGPAVSYRISGSLRPNYNLQPAKDAKNAKAPPPAKGGAGAAGKGNKKAEAPPADDPALRPQLAKIIKRQKKPDSSRGWTRERRELEVDYKKQFKDETSILVQNAVDRMIGLFDDIHAYQLEDAPKTQSEILASIEIAQSVAQKLIVEAEQDAALAKKLAAQQAENARREKEYQIKRGLAVKAMQAQPAEQVATPPVPVLNAPEAKGKAGKDKRKAPSSGKDRK
ncbi:hypothetical protein HDU82_001252 [Entophlyctis luteolus]|nr:hypothetical protein HDU82_001252 [Entophlyctis luteolus]